jgi:beta-mannosidase
MLTADGTPGQQHLYNVSVRLTGAASGAGAGAGTGVGASAISKKIGFRRVELVAPFHFVVNGVPVFLKGANWIPVDSFPERATEARVDWLLRSSVHANMNVLRNWGGGIYQTDFFYERCDEYGILVWEEFKFACALYPATSEFLASVSTEAAQQVTRLKHHPCVLLWSGNNENEVGLVDQWWDLPDSELPAYESMYSSLYFHTLERVITRTDASPRPFVPSSPSNWPSENASQPIASNPQSESLGDVHFYDYVHDCWNTSYFPSPRFASEYGYQSYPSFNALLAVSDAAAGDHAMDSAWMKHRMHHPDGLAQMRGQLDMHWAYPEEGNFRGQLWLYQVVQAMCYKSETEHYRRGRGTPARTMGSLYWQLNDVWQGASWSSMEYNGKWKVLHYFVEEFYASVLVSPYVHNDSLVIDAVNDQNGIRIGAGEARVEVELYEFSGVGDGGGATTVTFPLPDGGVPGGSSVGVASVPIHTLVRDAGGRVCADQSKGCIARVRLVGTASSSSRVLSENFAFLTDLKDPQASSLLDPNLRVVNITQASNSRVFRVSVEKKAPAALALFVWLELSSECVRQDPWIEMGAFSRNGFHMYPHDDNNNGDDMESDPSTSYISVEYEYAGPNELDETTFAKCITVNSLYDLYRGTN